MICSEVSSIYLAKANQLSAKLAKSISGTSPRVLGINETCESPVVDGHLNRLNIVNGRAVLRIFPRDFNLGAEMIDLDVTGATNIEPIAFDLDDLLTQAESGGADYDKLVALMREAA